MPKERAKTRDERREEHYLDGNARRPYTHTPILNSGEQNTESPSLSMDQREKICSRCLPVLSRYVDSFRELTHRVSHLKRVEHINPSPLSPDGDHYRDVKRQNEWIRENVFDVMGNFLFCASCVCSAFRISYQRLTRQRNVKR